MTMMNAQPRSPIGSRIAAYRKLRGFATAAALADAIPDQFVSKSTIINIEAGRKSDPSVRDILGIAYGLGLSPLALVFDLDHPFEPGSISGDRLPGDWAEDLNVQLLFEVLMLDGTEPTLDDSYGDAGYKANLAQDVVNYKAEAFVLNNEIEELERLSSSMPNNRARLEEQLTRLVGMRDAQEELAQILLRTAHLVGIHVPEDLSALDAYARRRARPQRRFAVEEDHPNRGLGRKK